MLQVAKTKSFRVHVSCTSRLRETVCVRVCVCDCEICACVHANVAKQVSCKVDAAAKVHASTVCCLSV